MRTVSPTRFDPVIRRARREDAPRLGTIAECAFAPFVEAIGRRPAPMDEDHHAAIVRNEALVAQRGDDVVGYATFASRGTAVELTTVAVDPVAQGLGLGQALIVAVEDRARAHGAIALTLYTNAKMASNLTYYPALGFDEVGRGEENGFQRVYFEKALMPAMATRPAVDGLFGRRLGQSGTRAPTHDPRLIDLRVQFDQAALFPAVTTLCLEVGFGSGEHLVAHGAREPQTGLIGVEPFQTGLARAMAAASAAPIHNVRFFGGDARRVLEWLPEGALDRVDVLYPDPWPKSRHWKRRFISRDGLDRLAGVLAPGGVIRFASDIDDYVRWTRAHVASHRAFTLAHDSAIAWPHWPGTRYEAKALAAGRTPRYLTLHRL